MSDLKPNETPRPEVSMAFVLAGALCGWFPLIWHFEYFWQFFYFMDEWDLINKMDLLGYQNWVFGFFAENFVPVFKLIWSGLIVSGNGNYHFIMVFGFLLHSLILLLIGYLLRMWGFGVFTILFSQLVVGVNYTHIEVLTWTSQYSSLLAFLSFLLVLIPFSRAYVGQIVTPWSVCALIFVVSALGALSFSRGVLNGVSIFGCCVVLWILRDPKVKSVWRAGISAMIPCVGIAVYIAIWSFSNSSNFSNSGSRLEAIFTHFFFRISLNPWYQQIRELQISWSQALILFQLNVMCLVFGIRWARKANRPLLYLLVLFFLGDAFLLALGRNHLHISSVAGWRYQYLILVLFTPFVGVIFEKFLGFERRDLIRRVTSVILMVVIARWVFIPWAWHLPTWSQERGTYAREKIVDDGLVAEDYDISKFDEVTNERALELKEKYNLH